jgi:FkbM family methyltransferase
MTLPWKERLTTRLMPSHLFYRKRIAEEAEWGEHELSVLRDIVAPGGTALDVGANQGFFAFAFVGLVDSVHAFEPNPDYADFARRMLGARAQVHQVALSNYVGTAEFVVPVAEDGTELHLGGNLSHGHAQPGNSLKYTVGVRTIDSYGFTNVRVIKIDVEGSEMQVLEGARTTIMRDRPSLIVELLTGAHADPIAVTGEICASYGYAAWIITKDGQRVEAIPVIRSLNSNTTWGSPIRNRNVLFLPKG